MPSFFKSMSVIDGKSYTLAPVINQMKVRIAVRFSGFVQDFWLE